MTMSAVRRQDVEAVLHPDHPYLNQMESVEAWNLITSVNMLYLLLRMKQLTWLIFPNRAPIAPG